MVLIPMNLIQCGSFTNLYPEKDRKIHTHTPRTFSVDVVKHHLKLLKVESDAIN